MRSSFSCCRTSYGEEEEPAWGPKHRVFTHEEIESATSGFSASSLLGRGSHGSVFLASLDQGRLLAAAKLPSQFSISSDSPSTADAEIGLLSCLPRSQLLVNLVGATPAAGPSPRIAVVDLMPQGSLHDLLHDQLRPAPPFPRRLRLALLSATALAHLHSFCVAHRDVKPANLLLDAKGRPRLADFGLAVGLSSRDGHEAAVLPQPAGTMGYLDPAYVHPEDVSTSTDVYSFGVVLLEVLSGREAIDVEYSPPSLVDWARRLLEEGRHEEIWDPRAAPEGRREKEAARAMADVAGRCLVAAARERPSMAEVVAELRGAERRIGLRGLRLARWAMRGRTEGKRSHPLSGNRRVSDVAAS
ncbi:serine/threonine-protein kinase-like protein At1g28390 [Musa acuminata AAA Group]|uniref:serine/threonine-protein kinase-like protein At1g28390 n=1 Tax=Musa acuminata AAA Group TaxID=214697 RepID=UPI0031E300CE